MTIAVCAKRESRWVLRMARAERELSIPQSIKDLRYREGEKER
jgi:hypothetical protein